MLGDLHDAGLALLSAAAEKQQREMTIYQPSYFDRLVLPSGLKFTPDALSQYLREAESGRTGRLFAFYTEMRARDPHLDGELQKQTDYIVSASLDVQAYPQVAPAVRGARITGDAKTAVDVREFLEARYGSPEYHMDDALTSLVDGEWFGIGGFQQIVAPDPTPGGTELVTSITPIPSQRFVYEMAGTRPMFQSTGALLPQVPLEELGPAGSGTLVVHQVDLSVPSPARRGVLRRCLNYWLIKQRGIVWWAQFVQNLGTPPLLGFYDATSDAKNILQKAFSELGNGSKMVLPKGTDVKPLEVAVRMAGETPHERISDWCDRQVSRVVSGHDQSSGVQRNAGSVSSTETGDEQGLRRAQSRAKRVARTLREWDAKPAVAREFGPDVAERFTSIIGLRVDRPKDLVGLGKAFADMGAAGCLASVPVRAFHDVTGLPMIEGFDGEAPIQAPAVMPAPIPPAAEAARVLAFQRAASVNDPTALLESLLRKAGRSAKGAGEEITGPYRDLIAAAVDEGLTIQQVVVRVLHRVTDPLDAPELEDLLAATIAEAALRGVQLERRRATH